jgi:hypothetical protein
LKCAVLKPGVYNLNRFRIIILEDEEEGHMKHHFVNEIRLTDDILLTATDSSDSRSKSPKKQGQVTFDSDKPLLQL